MPEPVQVEYDRVSAEDLAQAIKIEEEGFPPDEAASLETFQYRQTHAPSLFLGAFLPPSPSSTSPRELIAYICSTLSPSSPLTHASMSTHVHGAPHVCIHSICVSSPYRSRGVASALLSEYLKRLRGAGAKDAQGSRKYKDVLLITHEPLRGFYERAGFEWRGPSDVSHGSMQWFEMHLDLHAPASSARIAKSADEAVSVPGGAQQPPPAGLYEALAKASRKPRPAAKLLSEYTNGVEDVVMPHPEEASVRVNAKDLLCSRPRCGSFVLRLGKAVSVQRSSFNMDPPSLPAPPHLPALPEGLTHWWRVAPTPMEFENIGFSKAVEGMVAGKFFLSLLSPLPPPPSRPFMKSEKWISILMEPPESGRSLKLLSCAECGLGPIGWAEDGGTEFWVAASRVGYRA
ncbi:hypothetical protein DXG01_005462 [Tephrocybe rancida]|nr:hypothetical protein DXG01_005462 [Tephrocybe rancida]